MKKTTNTTAMPTTENTTKAPKTTGKRKPSVTPSQPAVQPKGTNDTAPDVADAVSKLSLDETVAELNKPESERVASGSTLFIHAKDLVTAENKGRIAAFGRKLFALMDEKGRAEMFKEFIANPNYTALVLSQDPKTGEYKTGDRKKEVSFSKLDRLYQLSKSTENDSEGKPIANKAVTLASDKKYDIMFNMLVDNIARFNAKEIEVTAPASSLESKTRAEYGFDGEVNITRLTAQLNKVVAAILPDDLPVELLKMHTKYMVMASTSYKARKIVGSKESILMSALFGALDNKINGTKLVFDSKAKIHKPNNK